jgi:hypothetical protein
MKLKNTKNHFAALIFILSFGFTAFCQEIDLSKEKIASRISKMWIVDHVNEKAKSFGLEGLVDQVYVFTKENTFNQSYDNSKNVKGNWEFVPDKKYISLTMKGMVFAKIVSLSDIEMILISSGYPEAKIYLKPNKD